MRSRFLKSLPYILAYEGETEEEKAAAAEAAAAAAAAVTDKKKQKVEFTKEQQEFLNAQLAEERRKGKGATDALITQLETQRQRADTTDAEKAQIESRIDQLRGEYATKEEQTKKTMDQQIKAEQTKREKAEKSATDWRDRFETRMIEGDLINAAVDAKAFNPQQVKTQLRPMTRIAEELDADGKPTGEYVSRVKMKKPGADGKPQVLEMTPAEAVKHLSEDPLYGNLFISGAAGGLGSGNNGRRTDGKSGHGKAPTDPAEYHEWRKKEKAAGRM